MTRVQYYDDVALGMMLVRTRTSAKAGADISQTKALAAKRTNE
jgi:hypothetical protein